MTVQRRGRAIGVGVASTTLALAFAGLVPFGFNLIVGRRYVVASDRGASRSRSIAERVCKAYEYVHSQAEKIPQE